MSHQATTVVPAAEKSLRRGRRRPVDTSVLVLMVVAATVSIATTVGIIIALAEPTIEFFTEISVVEFLTGTNWSPHFADKHYGVLPLVVTTIVGALIALVVAVPLGLGSAIYLAEYASDRARRITKPILELLAGIPTVVFGFFALYALNQILRDHWPFGGEPPGFNNIFVAGIAVGIMIVPTVASVSEDAMSAVPHNLREGAYALASSKMQVATRVVLPAAISGIIAAFVLGVSRAMGETMIFLIAGGVISDHVNFNPFDAASTMSAYIAYIAQGDIPVTSIDYKSVFAVGSLLFLLTFALNAVSIRMVRKFREVYE
jgi:phosphate transport system permease protein